MIKKQKYVTFYSPGTLFAEISRVPIESFDLKNAVELSKNITERHNARPYGFKFSEFEEGKADGYKIEPKQINLGVATPMYYLGGEVTKIQDIENNKENSILLLNLSNMNLNAIIENTNSWKITQPFRREDFLLDENGNVVDKGESYYE